MAVLVDGDTPTLAAPSAARELQERLSLEFALPTGPFPEPYVERWSPRASLMVIGGGSLVLWGAIAVFASLL